MKKLFLLIIVPIILLAGCGDKDTPPQSSVENQCYSGAPDWVLGNAEGALSAVGSSKIGKAGMQFARTAALGNARDEFARAISINVNNMLKDFTQATGVGDDEVVDRVTSSTSKQVASQTLNGIRQKAIWQSPCQELYVLVAVDEAAMQASVRNSVNSSYRNENALWQQFQAQKNQEELDAAIKSTFSDK